MGGPLLAQHALRTPNMAVPSPSTSRPAPAFPFPFSTSTARAEKPAEGQPLPAAEPNKKKPPCREANGKEDLGKNLLKLWNDQKEAVLKFSITWNTNSRNYLKTQAVVETLLKHETPESLLQYEGIKAAVESLPPYTERHFQRLGRLLQASMFLDFMWQNMKLPDAAKWDEQIDT
ncbi:beta 3 [Podarcis lilfordi]|uniref:Beta 3 n=1 Tax=Podarcis lilfordi TaxID=74358 RepID=A0AA35PGQ4_9SAUR|nr:beta 3 [Podarcis lilfordi]